MEKYKEQQAKMLLKYYQRKFKNYSNKDIDTTKSYLNYDLTESDIEDAYERYKQRIKQVKCLKRKDVNTLCTWVITQPENIDNRYQKDFFKNVYNFLSNKYGIKNTMCACVHLDQGRAHMHFAFIPVSKNKKDIERVCAKEVINLKELQIFHESLKKYLEDKMNMEIDIINHKTKDAEQTIKELYAEVARLKKEINYIKTKENNIKMNSYRIGEQIKLELY